MNKTLEEMTREELAEVAADWKVEFTAETTDDELRKLINDEMDKAEPIMPEAIDAMTRDDMIAFGASLGIELKGNEATIRKQLKAGLEELGGTETEALTGGEQDDWQTSEATECRSYSTAGSALPTEDKGRGAKLGAGCADGAKTIEAWADEKRLPSWQLAAAMQANKWAPGKKLTEEELATGLDALNRPMGR